MLKADVRCIVYLLVEWFEERWRWIVPQIEEWKCHAKKAKEGGCVARGIEGQRQRRGWLCMGTFRGKEFDGGYKDSRCIELTARFEVF